MPCGAPGQKMEQVGHVLQIRHPPFSRLMMATWTGGQVVERRMLPSFSRSRMEPVSATAMLAPVIPISAERNFFAQHPPGDEGQLLDVLGGFSQGVGEETGHVLPGHMHGRGDEVGRAFSGQLDDEFPQVRFPDFQAARFQGLIQPDLF